MKRRARGVRVLICGLVVLAVFARPAKGQGEASSQTILPDNPVVKPFGEPALPAPEPPKPEAIANSMGGRHKFTKTTKLWAASSVAVYTASILDMRATQHMLQSVYQYKKQYPTAWYGLYDFEGDPLARPLLKLPAPAYYAFGIALATGVNWASLRMSRSKRFRKVWWIPQAISVSGNVFGYHSYQ